MRRVACLIPFLVAGCSTAPMAGTMDCIDSHHRKRAERDEPRPPPFGGGYEPTSKNRLDDPIQPVGNRSRDTDVQPAAAFEPARKVKQPEPAPPKPKDADTEDVPPAPPRQKEKPFEPKDRVRQTSLPRTPDADAPLPDAKPNKVLPAPRLSSDERDDF